MKDVSKQKLIASLQRAIRSIEHERYSVARLYMREARRRLRDCLRVGAGPFVDLGVGETIYLPVEGIGKVRTYASRANKLGRKYTVRKSRQRDDQYVLRRIR